MKIIYKYKVEHQVEMLIGAKILSVQVQNNEAYFWAEVEQSETRKEWRLFSIFQTGAPFTGINLNYIGTVLLDGGAFIQHVYEQL